jgi:hypothetical protein
MESGMERELINLELIIDLIKMGKEKSPHLSLYHGER